MARIKFVQQWVDKRDGGAVARYYFRRRGSKRVPLPGMPGSPEFNEAYQAALAGQSVPTPVGASRIKADSINALVIAYFSSDTFLALAPGTQQTYRLILEKFAAEFGDNPVALLERKHIKSMLAKKVATPAAANHWLRLVKALMAFAVEEGFRWDDPTVGVKRIKTRGKGFHGWTEQEIARFESRHPVGSKARLALALGLYTAQRLSDVVRMGRQHIAGDALTVRQQKTGVRLMIPVHPKLAAILAATASGNMTFLVTEYGCPFTSAGFGNWFRDRCNEGGLPNQCRFHGLRLAACTRLADAGCSSRVIAAISGHTTLREVERYTRAADQKRLARVGVNMMETESVNATDAVDDSRKNA
jgi:integrase